MQKGIIIGMVGSFGSGCTKIARSFIEPRGYNYLSLGDILVKHYLTEYPGSQEPVLRSELQDYGNDIRSRYGPGYLAEIAIKKIEESNDDVNWVIDSFRNPEEMEVFRQRFNK